MAAARKSILRLNLALGFAEAICITAFIIEIQRALGGNTLSWAYVFEWPLLSVYAVYMWRKLLREERGEASGRPVVYDSEDPALDAWNAYLESVHQSDRPSATSDDG
jgi:hypothetical protein